MSIRNIKPWMHSHASGIVKRAAANLTVFLLLLAGVSTGITPVAHATAPNGTVTYVIDNSWAPADVTTLQSYIDPNGLVQKALIAVTGKPLNNMTITIHNGSANNGPADYDQVDNIINMNNTDVAVFAHEMQHATRNTFDMSNAVYEEGMARAGEVTILSKLVDEGYQLPQNSSGNPHFNYYYYEYSDATNYPGIGATGGDLYVSPDLALTRYDVAGWAFGRMELDNPNFISSFNAALFNTTGTQTTDQLKAILASVSPHVQGDSFAHWYANQAIFNTTPPTGCQLFQRPVFYVIDAFCRATNGIETAQSGVVPTVKVYDDANNLLQTTTAPATSAAPYGNTEWTPSLGSYVGRIKIVVTATLGGTAVSSTDYLTYGIPTTGLFGVVTDTSSGTVTLKSPDGKFATVTVPLTHGAFSAPTLNNIADSAFTVNVISGSKNFTVQRDKDTSPLYMQTTSF